MKKTFTILHTNDRHSSFIGMGPAADYTPFTLNDDAPDRIVHHGLFDAMAM